MLSFFLYPYVLIRVSPDDTTIDATIDRHEDSWEDTKQMFEGGFDAVVVVCNNFIMHRCSIQ
jgi:hypothetical protein